MGVGAVIIKGEGSDIRECRGTGRTVHNYEWKEEIKNMCRQPMKHIVEIDVGVRWRWTGGRQEEESQAVGK